jgi:6-phosphogluconolactonase
MPFISTFPGSGPRHLTFNPKGNLAFSAEELSSSICSYKVNKKTGALERVHHLPALPDAFYGENSSADVHTSPDGKYVYISNRGYNGLAMFKITSGGGMKNIGYMPTIGSQPRNFLPDPKGYFMLIGNRDSNEINVFLMEKDGTISVTSDYLPVPSPVCIKYLEIK